MARSGRPVGALSAGLIVVAAAVAGAIAGPTAAASPDPSGTPRASAPSEEHPAGALQALVDAALPGAVVVAPPGIYRETVEIDRPLTLRGDGAEIRGSEVWSDWAASGARWRSEATVPNFAGGGQCRDPRCAWPEQVFVDGQPLFQVAERPGPGQFAVDPDRHVLLGDDPAGRVVEVTVRERWLTVQAPEVTVEDFGMRQAASPPQHGALQALPGADRLTLQRLRLSDAHGALVSFQGVGGGRLVSSDLSRAGQLGVHAGGDGTTELTIEDNRITGNNTEGFESAWEAGGLKAALATGLRVVGNDVTGNDGPGIWCDIDCRDFVAEGNRVEGNTGPGIMFEISDGATVEDNVVWENGWGHPTWGWGAGILISSSTAATVRDNLLAWNADGISVISQARNRPGGDAVRDVLVADNTVLSDASAGFMLAWLQDWPGPMFDAASGNEGTGNTFWSETPDPSDCRFAWSDCIDALEAFDATPGGADSSYLTNAAAREILTSNDVPNQPIAHPAGEPPRLRTVVFAAGIAVLVGVVLIVGAIALIRVRRRRRASRGAVDG
jgi:parallel beta helix pectate lyase-like protein